MMAEIAHFYKGNGGYIVICINNCTELFMHLARGVYPRAVGGGAKPPLTADGFDTHLCNNLLK
jgi:hypothetical protein